MRSFYENGKPRTVFELDDAKNRIYQCREYYPNGQLRESGVKVRNLVANDYQMNGIWLYYDENGKLIMEEEYVYGQLIRDKQF
jgi:antitoxin component YwqK of YwqJK toxin-antitoxin module